MSSASFTSRLSSNPLPQAQDSLDHSFFDFPVGEFLEGDEEISSAMVPGKLSKEAQAWLLDIHRLLQREALKDLRGLLPQDVEAAIIPTAFIECHQVEVLMAKQRMEDRQSSETLLTQSESARDQATATKGKIDLLEYSHPTITMEKNLIT